MLFVATLLTLQTSVFERTMGRPLPVDRNRPIVRSFSKIRTAITRVRYIFKSKHCGHGSDHFRIYGAT